MIIFWIHLVKKNTFLKLLSPLKNCPFSKATRKVKINMWITLYFYWTMLVYILTFPCTHGYTRLKMVKQMERKNFLIETHPRNLSASVLCLRSEIFYYFFYGTTVDLQYCVSFRGTAKWFSYIYIFWKRIYIYPDKDIYIYFFRFFSIIGCYNTLNMVPCAIQ